MARRGPRAKKPRSTPLPASPGRRKLLRSLAAAGLVTLPTAAYARWIEPNTLRVAGLDVKLPGWPRAAEGYRIGHISDLHADSANEAHRARAAAELLLSQMPDVVFLTGDLFTFHAHPAAERCVAALAPLARAPGGVYAVFGNHDHVGRQEEYVATCMAAAGFRVLRNRATPLKEVPGVWIVGLDSMSWARDDVEAALAGVPPHALKLLLVHEPDYADRAPAGFALQFSGHSHGGQIRIPGLPPLHVPLYSQHYPEGLRQGPRHAVYTTRGVGMIGIRVRFCCPPEVGLLRILPA